LLCSLKNDQITTVTFLLPPQPALRYNAHKQSNYKTGLQHCQRAGDKQTPTWVVCYQFDGPQKRFYHFIMYNQMTVIAHQPDGD
jgi:hypothetical protein